MVRLRLFFRLADSRVRLVFFRGCFVLGVRLAFFRGFYAYSLRSVSVWGSFLGFFLAFFYRRLRGFFFGVYGSTSSFFSPCGFPGLSGFLSGLLCVGGSSGFLSWFLCLLTSFRVGLGIVFGVVFWPFFIDVWCVFIDVWVVFVDIKFGFSLLFCVFFRTFVL